VSSERNIAVPFASWPVMMRRTGCAMFNCGGDMMEIGGG
jgi:hypothetical protein